MKKECNASKFMQKLNQIDGLLDDERISRVFRAMLEQERKDLVNEMLSKKEEKGKHILYLIELAKEIEPDTKDIFKCEMESKYYWTGAWFLDIGKAVNGLLGWSYEEAEENLKAGYIEWF